MRKASIRVGSTPLGTIGTWAYPNGKSLGLFLIPAYTLTLTGTSAKGTPLTARGTALRFGVTCTDGVHAQVVGLSNQQTHTIKTWIPTYRVHSAPSLEDGAWQVYNNFLIHDGPDSLAEIYATVGCIEVMGPSGFIHFNDRLIEMVGPTSKTRGAKLAEIGRSGLVTITYEAAARPPLVKFR